MIPLVSTPPVVSSPHIRSPWHAEPGVGTDAPAPPPIEDLVGSGAWLCAAPQEVEKHGHRGHPFIRTLLKVGAGVTLAAALAAGVSIGALTNHLPPPIETPVKTLVLQALPSPLRDGYTFLTAPNPNVEPAADRGKLYLLTPDGKGKATVVASQAATRPDGHDIPAAAVKDGRIVVSFEGIESSPGWYASTYTELLNSPTGVVNLGQPILDIHEGNSATVGSDVSRIATDWLYTRALEAGLDPSMADMFKTDPAVETGYNILKQALDQRQDVLVIAHSGGGAESAEVLNLLASQGYRQAIGEHVKVVSLAGAASREDAIHAGVKPNHALYLGMQDDGVAQIGHPYVSPVVPLPGLVQVAQGASSASDWLLGDDHLPFTIVHANEAHLVAFLDEGEGGTFLTDN